MRVKTSIYCFFIVVFYSCTEQQVMRQPHVNEISIIGTVTFLNFEGGFYGIISDDGTKYNPTNLSKEFRVADLRVMLIAERQRNTHSIQMWDLLLK